MRLQATEFSEIGLTHGNGLYAVITPFKVIQGHQFIPTFQVQYLFYKNCIYGFNEIIQ